MRILVCIAVAIILTSLRGSHSQNLPGVRPTTLPRPGPARCGGLCPRIYRPVCGSFNGVLRTVGSRCVLNAEISCARRRPSAGSQLVPKIKFLYNGPCRSKSQNLPGVRSTTLKPPGTAQCGGLCPRIYRPVCGSFNGVLRTVGSRCVLNAEISCARRRPSAGSQLVPKVKFLYNGPCRIGVGNKSQNLPGVRSTTLKPPGTARCGGLCTRIYRPVCGSFNGVLRTVSSRCVLNAEISCARRRPSAGSQLVANIKFLYNGSCRTEPKRHNRRTTRRDGRRPTQRTGRRSARRRNARLNRQRDAAISTTPMSIDTDPSTSAYTDYYYS